MYVGGSRGVCWKIVRLGKWAIEAGSEDFNGVRASKRHNRYMYSTLMSRTFV